MSRKSVKKFKITNLDFIFKSKSDYIKYKKQTDSEFKVIGDPSVGGEMFYYVVSKNLVPFGYFLKGFFMLIAMLPIGLEIELFKFLAKKFNFAKKRIEYLKPIYRKRYFKSIELFIIGQYVARVITYTRREEKIKILDEYMEYFMWETFDK